jgi:hypothetical protein
MTVSAKAKTASAIGSCIRVNMASITNSAVSFVPDSFFTFHVTGFMRFWICIFYSIIINMAA